MPAAKPRRLRRLGLALAAVLLLLAPAAGYGGDAALELRGFAQAHGLHDVVGFVDAVTTLRLTHHLPQRYLTKRRARQLGWHPGGDLCAVAPGDAIGGDPFRPRRNALPSAAGRRWHEADLDYACGHRGASRLVWSSDGLYFITVDHYASFAPVP